MIGRPHSTLETSAIRFLRHCERSEAIQRAPAGAPQNAPDRAALFCWRACRRAAGLLRRFAPRNDAVGIARVGAVALALSVSSHALAQGAPKSITPTLAPTAGSAPATSPTTSSNAPPNALQGFSQNRDKPIAIDAARLEVRDKDKVAMFFGDAKADVKVVQGDTTMRSKVLV